MAFDPDNVLMQDSRTGTIPTEQGELVLKEFMTNSAVAQLARYEPMTKPKKTFTYLAEGPGAYWVNEGEKIQTSKAEWLTATMEAKKLGVILPVSKEFLNYTVSDFFAQMREAIAEAFYAKFDQAALFGIDSPYAAGTSIWEGITASGNTIVNGSGQNLYEDLNGLLALIEEGDNDPDGFTTTRRFRKDLRGAVDSNGLPIFNAPRDGSTAQVLDCRSGTPTAHRGTPARPTSSQETGISPDMESCRASSTKYPRMPRSPPWWMAARVPSTCSSVTCSRCVPPCT